MRLFVHLPGWCDTLNQEVLRMKFEPRFNKEDKTLDLAIQLEPSDFWKDKQIEKPTFAAGDRIRMNEDGSKGIIELIHYTDIFVVYFIVWDNPNQWPKSIWLENAPGHGMEMIASKAVDVQLQQL